MSISRLNNSDMQFINSLSSSQEGLGEGTGSLNGYSTFGIFKDDCDYVDVEGVWSRVPGLFRNQRVFLPEQFTPAFSYPLIVTICDQQHSNEKSLHEKISLQNYIGLNINLAELGLDNSVKVAELTEVVTELIQDFLQIFLVNEQQVYVLAQGEMANTALSIVANAAHIFAGLLLVNPQHDGAAKSSINSQLVRKLRIAIIDEVCHPHNWDTQKYHELRKFPFRQLSAFGYDDLMVHHNEYEVLNRFVMSGMEHVVW